MTMENSSQAENTRSLQLSMGFKLTTSSPYYPKGNGSIGEAGTNHQESAQQV